MDVLSSCTSYSGGARGVRASPSGHRSNSMSRRCRLVLSGVKSQGLGLYGDHHGFGLWEAAVSVAFHEGDDQAATAVRGAVGDRTAHDLHAVL